MSNEQSLAFAAHRFHRIVFNFITSRLSLARSATKFPFPFVLFVVPTPNSQPEIPFAGNDYLATTNPSRTKTVPLYLIRKNNATLREVKFIGIPIESSLNSKRLNAPWNS